MAGLFGKIAKWGLTGLGTVLSLVPGVGPLIGAPLIVAGQAINIKTAGTIDKVSQAGAQLATTLNSVAAMQSSQQNPGLTIGTDSVITFIKDNFLIIIIAIAAIFVLPKLIGGRRR